MTGNRTGYLARKGPTASHALPRRPPDATNPLPDAAPRAGPTPLPWGLALLVIASLSAATWLGVIWLVHELMIW